MKQPAMHPGVTVRVVDGKGYLTVVTDDAVTEVEMTGDELSALSGEALRKAIMIAMT